MQKYSRFQLKGSDSFVKAFLQIFQSEREIFKSRVSRQSELTSFSKYEREYLNIPFHTWRMKSVHFDEKLLI